MCSSVVNFIINVTLRELCNVTYTDHHYLSFIVKQL